MVLLNWGSPDPENPPDDLSPNNEIILVMENETDEEDHYYHDYQPLAMNDTVGISDEDDNSSDSEEVLGAAAIVEDSLPPIRRMEDTLVTEVWAGSSPKAVDIEMDSDKVDEVKQAMMNFTLPASSIPEWANNIPEEQWKEQLMNRLKTKESDNEQ